MTINHLNFTVTNVDAAARFFETYFEFRRLDKKPNDSLSILDNADGFLLVLMSEKMNENGNTGYPDVFHAGFMLDSMQQVIDLHNNLKAGGITLDQEPQRMRKSFGFYFNIDKIMIEVGTFNLDA
ncbi:VOC family protein [Chitinophaga pendula]|uniref:VOC family protein n=1 Tax=Chitinophaga TaxID=79328 RepID=UPI000BAE806C|nr:MULTISPECIES: VOC family protein [Chitinophaga]ASZ09944.1 glyoxalase/bleomycin resistance/extradiol dioxygenase family protein [Chitinophaga sp. MD30]UCJ07115.1 VOC family protein [Chitinophaga pendula]